MVDDLDMMNLYSKINYHIHVYSHREERYTLELLKSESIYA